MTMHQKKQNDLSVMDATVIEATGNGLAFEGRDVTADFDDKYRTVTASYFLEDLNLTHSITLYLEKDRIRGGATLEFIPGPHSPYHVLYALSDLKQWAIAGKITITKVDGPSFSATFSFETPSGHHVENGSLYLAVAS